MAPTSWFQLLDANKNPNWAEAYIQHSTFREDIQRLTGEPESSDSWEHWCSSLLEEVQKTVDPHFLGIVRSMNLQLEQVSMRGRMMEQQADKTTKEMDRLSLEKDLSKVVSRIRQLNEYSSHNFSLCLKLLEEFQEVGGSSEEAARALSGIRHCHFHDSHVLEELHRRVSALSSSLGLDAFGHALRFQYQTARESSLHTFLLGLHIMCWIDIAVLLWIPGTNPKFQWSAFADALPLFRTGFMMSILLWSAAFAIHVFELYRVNYQMLLNIHPTINPNAGSMFALAQIQTTIVTLLFLAYVVDFKFGLLFNTELSFKVYPCAQAVLTVVVWILPVNVLPWVNAARYNLAACFFSVCFACVPTCDVTFASNLLGDVLTSFTKPLQDVIYTGCYLTYAVVGQSIHVEAIAAGCRPLQSSLITMLILDLPFFFRLQQCIRRYFDSKERTHLLNAGKYSCSLLVSVVTFMDWHRRGLSAKASLALVLAVSSAATAYSLVWDLHMDWGLMPSFPRCDTFSRSRQLYPEVVYKGFAAFDAIARLTWVTGLMPNSWLYRDAVGAENIVLMLSVVEVVRRAGWAVLRVEHEQLANASHYRDVLWVPDLKLERLCSSDFKEETHRESQKELHSPTSPLREGLLRQHRLPTASLAASYHGLLDLPLLQSSSGIQLASQSLATAMYPDNGHSATPRHRASHRGPEGELGRK